MTHILFTLIIALAAMAFGFYWGADYGRWQEARTAKKPVTVRKPRAPKAPKVEAAAEPDWDAIGAAVNQLITDTAKAGYVAAKRNWTIKPREDGGINVFTRFEAEQFLMAYINANEGTVVNPAVEAVWTKAMTPGQQKAPVLSEGPAYDDDYAGPPSQSY